MTMFRYAALPAVFMLIGCASSWTPRSEGAALDQFAEIGLVIHASDRVVSQFMEIVFSDDPAMPSIEIWTTRRPAREAVSDYAAQLEALGFRRSLFEMDSISNPPLPTPVFFCAADATVAITPDQDGAYKNPPWRFRGKLIALSYSSTPCTPMVEAEIHDS